MVESGFKFALVELTLRQGAFVAGCSDGARPLGAARHYWRSRCGRSSIRCQSLATDIRSVPTPKDHQGAATLSWLTSTSVQSHRSNRRVQPMRAIQFESFGGPEVLRSVDVAEPHAATGQI